MNIDSLYWDDENIEKISKHNVSPQEVEDVCFETHIIRREGDRRYILSGQSANGRYLNVVIERVHKGSFRPITAFEMSENYKRRYRKRLRN
jgi:uncharacterized DUF497 family protein